MILFKSYLYGNKDPKPFNKRKYFQNELKTLTETSTEKYYLPM